MQDLIKIDIGVGAQTALKELNLFPEKTRKFKADCGDVIKSVILKFVEKTPLRYNFVRLSSALVPKHIVENRSILTDLGFWLMGFLLPKKFHLLLLTKQNSSILRYKHLHRRSTIIPNFPNFII